MRVDICNCILYVTLGGNFGGTTNHTWSGHFERHCNNHCEGVFFTTPHFHLELVEALFLILNEQVGGEFEKLYLYMTLGWVNCGTAISYTPMKYFSISFLEHQFDFKNKSSTNRKKTRQYKNS